MSSELEKKVEEYQEDLRTVANAECSASWIAQELLESFGMNVSHSTSEPTETNVDRDISPKNPPEEQSTEPEGSIFAY